MLRLFVATLTALLLSASAGALPRHSPVPGGIAVVDLGAAQGTAPRAKLGEQALAVIRSSGHWHALVGIALDTAPGQLNFSVQRDNTAQTLTVEVKNKAYPEQRLTIRDQNKVTPSDEDLARIEREQAITDAVKHRFSATSPDTDLQLPASGRLSSRFGLKRFFNGEARKPHAGLDVAGAAGSQVNAPAAGIVVNVGEYFFNGNTVFVDHGQGLITAYMHLSRIDVKEGQSVRRGDRLGAIGATGRVTGPHLHWAAILNGTPVDPELLLTAGANANANHPPASQRAAQARHR